MSVEAISWALNHAPVSSPTSKLVLIALANHARPDGSAAFPSVETISRYTCLSERAIRHHLDALEADGVIKRCDPGIVAAYIKRSDRRPIGFDLCINRVQEVHLAESRGASHARHGVQEVPERGAGGAPEPYKEPYKENRPFLVSDAPASDPLPTVLTESPHLDDARRLCQLLADCMVENGIKAPSITTTWIGEMDRLMRIDGRSAAQVETAIRWSQNHEFWKANILSPTKLRAKYDQLRLQAQREMQRSQPRGFNAIREFLADDRSPIA